MSSNDDIRRAERALRERLADTKTMIKKLAKRGALSDGTLAHLVTGFPPRATNQLLDTVLELSGVLPFPLPMTFERLHEQMPGQTVTVLRLFPVERDYPDRTFQEFIHAFRDDIDFHAVTPMRGNALQRAVAKHRPVVVQLLLDTDEYSRQEKQEALELALEPFFRYLPDDPMITELRASLAQRPFKGSEREAWMKAARGGTLRRRSRVSKARSRKSRKVRRTFSRSRLTK